MLSFLLSPLSRYRTLLLKGSVLVRTVRIHCRFLILFFTSKLVLECIRRLFLQSKDVLLVQIFSKFGQITHVSPPYQTETNVGVALDSCQARTKCLQNYLTSNNSLTQRIDGYHRSDARSVLTLHIMVYEYLTLPNGSPYKINLADFVRQSRERFFHLLFLQKVVLQFVCHNIYVL